MQGEPSYQPDGPNFASIEGNQFGALFISYDKTTKLLRQSSLDDDKLKVVSERIQRLLEDSRAEMVRTNDFSNLARRLDTAYGELKRLVEDLSDPPLDVATPSKRRPKRRPKRD